MKKKLTYALKKIRRLLADSRKRDLNEVETKNLVERFFEAVLGYDLFRELSAEEVVERRAADYAVKIGKKVLLLIEIKRIQSRLKNSHVFQLKNYAASKGVRWCVLTNAIDYRLYHIDFSEAVQHQIVFETNLVDDSPSDVASKIYYLTRRGLLRNEIEKYWRRKKSLSEESLLQAILSPRVLRTIRKQIQTHDRQRISELDIARELKRMFSEQLYTVYEKLTKRLQRKKRKIRRQIPKRIVSTRAPTLIPIPSKLEHPPIS